MNLREREESEIFKKKHYTTLSGEFALYGCLRLIARNTKAYLNPKQAADPPR
jgi:hypothetical protein